MTLERPDLSNVNPDVLAYIEALEAELERRRPTAPSASDSSLEPSEPPTTLNLITVSRSGLAKRTPRHHYTRQRRGGMGIFDLETPDKDPPDRLLIADESQDLLLITSQGRAFRRPVSNLPEAEIRSRGQALTADLPLEGDESLALVMPHRGSGYLVVVSHTGQVRRLRHHFFGDNMTPGNLIYDTRALGQPVTACWSEGDGDVLIATRQGKGIRFSEQNIPFKGCQGIRLSDDDAIVSICPVTDESSVFLLTADGKGTIRLMNGFSANKSPGGGGKVTIKSDQVVSANPVDNSDDIFVLSRLSKIIRFQAADVPPKEGVVQGVNCMALRADETVAVTIAKMESE